MLSIGALISHQISGVFQHLGLLISRHTRLFFWTPVILTIVSTFGLSRFSEENRIWYLYSPTEALSHHEHAVANEFFNDKGGKFLLEVLITSRDGGNLLRDGYLEEVEELAHYFRHNLTVECEFMNKNQCSFQDVCSSNCNDNQVIKIFRYIHRNISRRLHPNFRLTYPTMQIYNNQYYVGEHFSGVSIDQKTNRISDIRLIVLYYRTDRQNKHNNDIINRWEKNLLSYVYSFRHPFINISCSSDGLFSSEVRRNGLSCIPYFALSVIAVFSFIFFTNQGFCISDQLFVAAMGTIGPLLSISTTFTMLMAFGVSFNSITLVVPFLIMGVGCDDVFLIVQAWRRTNPSDTVDRRIAATLCEAGPSITITSITNALSFGIGIFTSTPAISLFCIYATLGVLIDFVYQVTFFVAGIVIYQGSLSQTNRPNTLMQSSALEQLRLIKQYTMLLNKSNCQLVVLSVVVIYWCVSIFGCVTMVVKMDSSNLILNDSPLINVAWLYENYVWKEGSLFYVFVNSPPDLSSEGAQNRMLNLVSRFEMLKYSMGSNSTAFWLRPFLSQAAFFENENNVTFYGLLDQWLKDEGNRWNDFMQMEYNNQNVIGIKKFFFATAVAMGNQSSWILRANLQSSWRDLAYFYRKYNVTIYQPYSFYVDQLDSMKSTTINTMITVMLAMAFVCFLTIPSTKSIIFSSLAMLSINVGVFGGLSLWGVYMDPLTMCTTLTSIGFSVDFTVHICYHYYRSLAIKPSTERIEEALSSIGWPMIQAGLSTMLCVLPLLIIDSYMAHVFLKTILLVVFLGLIHGILFLPCLLLIFNTDQLVTVSQFPLSIWKKGILIRDGTVKQKFERMISLPPSNQTVANETSDKITVRRCRSA